MSRSVRWEINLEAMATSLNEAVIFRISPRA
jgi:hypothetical protein